MKILVERIPDGGMDLDGEEPGEILELEGDPFVRRPGDIAYALHAERASGELVVRGTLSFQVELMCSRCGEFFSTTVRVSDFLRAYSAPQGTAEVDITEDLREAVLLELPSFALCDPDCPGLEGSFGPDPERENSCSRGEDAGGGPWDALDKLMGSDLPRRN